MGLKAYWAYAFVCDRPLSNILLTLNQEGPWQWAARDSHWYGDYLNCRPIKGVRVRIHEWEDASFTLLLQIETNSEAKQVDVDKIARGLLGLLEARDIEEAEPYD